VGKFLRLATTDRAVLVRSIVTLAGARVALWVLPFRTVRRLLGPPSGAEPCPALTPERVRWAIQHAQRVVPEATCLPQALAGEALLTRGGNPAELQIGVRKTAAGKFEAHAWVESRGRIVVGDLPGGLGEYTRLPRLPDAWPGAGPVGSS
jgi:hypothetical protein